MKWKRKKFRIKRKFAFFPKLINDYYHCFTFYYMKQNLRYNHWEALWIWDTEDYTTKEEYLKWKGDK